MTPPVELCFGCMEARDPSGFCPHCGYHHGTPPTSSLYLKPGTVLQEQYIVGRVLGQGGFGVTYLGFDSVLQRRIAIKEYLPSSLASRQNETAHLSVHYEQLRTDYDFGLQRFLEEARTLARFHGFPNIIWVMNFFSANGTAYMVMEYLEGETFESYLGRNHGRISFAAARAILMPVMDALKEIHRQNFLHRDISPDNIFLVNGGPVKLLDFGAARYAMSMRSQGLSVIIKQGYAPEEQYTSKGEQGPWSDVYALGGTMYRAITGHLPSSALERRMSEELTLPSLLGSDIPPESEKVLMRALAVDAAERYQSIEEFQAALAEASPAGGGATLRHELIETQALRPEQRLTAPPTRAAPGRPSAVLSPPTSRPLDVQPVQRRGVSPGMLLMVGIGGAILLMGAGYLGFRGYIHPKPMGQTTPLQVNVFSAKDASIAAGTATTLTWDVSNADHVVIAPGPGVVAASGSAQVTPKQTTTYRLSATSRDGKAVDTSVQVMVAPSAVAAESKPTPFPVPEAPVVPPVSTPLVPDTGPGASAPTVPSGGSTPVLVPDAAKSQFLVSHDRGKAPATMGVLEVRDGRVTFRSSSTDQPRDDFDEPVSAIAEAKKNHRFLPGGQLFHIKFKDGTNYNFDARNATAGQVLKALSGK